jgi:hypothetical protein
MSNAEAERKKILHSGSEFYIAEGFHDITITNCMERKIIGIIEICQKNANLVAILRCLKMILGCLDATERCLEMIFRCLVAVTREA